MCNVNRQVEADFTAVIRSYFFPGKFRKRTE